MERGSSKHSPHVDEQMKREGNGGRAEQWRMAEPPGEEPPADLTEFGRFIGPTALPGDRVALRRSAVALAAPDEVLDDLDRLPEGITFETVSQIWAVIDQHKRQTEAGGR